MTPELEIRSMQEEVEQLQEQEKMFGFDREVNKRIISLRHQIEISLAYLQSLQS